MPVQKRNGVRNRSEPPRRFAAVSVGIQLRNGGSVQRCAGPNINQHQHQRRNRAVVSAGRPFFCPDFRPDQPKQFRQQNSGQQDRRDPHVHPRQPIPGESRLAPRPQQRHSSRRAQIHQNMHHRRKRRGHKQRGNSPIRCSGRLLRRVFCVPDGFAGRAALHPQQSRTNQRRPDHHRRSQNRMCNCVSDGKIRRRPDKRGNQIQVRNRPCQHHA